MENQMKLEEAKKVPQAVAMLERVLPAGSLSVEGMKLKLLQELCNKTCEFQNEAPSQWSGSPVVGTQPSVCEEGRKKSEEEGAVGPDDMDAKKGMEGVEAESMEMNGEEETDYLDGSEGIKVVLVNENDPFFSPWMDGKSRAGRKNSLSVDVPNPQQSLNILMDQPGQITPDIPRETPKPIGHRSDKGGRAMPESRRRTSTPIDQSMGTDGKVRPEFSVELIFDTNQKEDQVQCLPTAGRHGSNGLGSQETDVLSSHATVITWIPGEEGNITDQEETKPDRTTDSGVMSKIPSCMTPHTNLSLSGQIKMIVADLEVPKPQKNDVAATGCCFSGPFSEDGSTPGGEQLSADGGSSPTDNTIQGTGNIPTTELRTRTKAGGGDAIPFWMIDDESLVVVPIKRDATEERVNVGRAAGGMDPPEDNSPPLRRRPQTPIVIDPEEGITSPPPVVNVSSGEVVKQLFFSSATARQDRRNGAGQPSGGIGGRGDAGDTNRRPTSGVVPVPGGRVDPSQGSGSTVRSVTANPGFTCGNVTNQCPPKDRGPTVDTTFSCRIKSCELFY